MSAQTTEKPCTLRSPAQIKRDLVTFTRRRRGRQYAALVENTLDRHWGKRLLSKAAHELTPDEVQKMFAPWFLGLQLAARSGYLFYSYDWKALEKPGPAALRKSAEFWERYAR